MSTASTNQYAPRAAFHSPGPSTGWADRPPAEGIAVDRVAGLEAGGVRTAIRVLIAAGSALMRAGYRALLEGDNRIEVVAEAADSHDAMVLAEDTKPDVALLDLTLWRLEDTKAAAIVSHPSLARVAVMLIGPDEEEDVFSTLRAGALGVLATDAEPAELIRAVRLLGAGNALLPVGAVRRLLGQLPPPSRNRPVLEPFVELTNREREVVTLAAGGLSNGEIAARLVISPATAKTHISRAMIKAQARNRAQLVVFAYEAGLALAPG